MMSRSVQVPIASFIAFFEQDAEILPRGPPTITFDL